VASDLEILQNFAQSLAPYDAKTVKAYLSAMRGFVKWLIEQPGGNPFSPDKITETAINSYLNYMVAISRAPRTRNLTLTALRRFCRWAIDEGYMINN
jgi:site-specific recombinase XerD